MDRCPSCPNKYNCVGGNGPQPTRVMLIGEAPGFNEDRARKPFVGTSGMELDNTYLPLAGWDRADVRVDNVVRCRPDLNRKPSPKEIEGCSSHHLPYELLTTNPDVVVLMGASACSLVDVGLEVEHGIPRRGELYGWQGWIVGMYHPASGLHETAMMTPMLEDWSKLGQWWKGEYVWPVDRRKRDYKLIGNTNDLRDIASHSNLIGLGFDTESHGSNPFSFQFSLSVGSARLVKLNDVGLVKVVVRILNHMPHPFIAMHNSPADKAIADMIGLRVNNLRDTLIEAYHFQDLKQGLKPLSRRLLGRKRLSWDEVVGPPSVSKVEQWLMEAYDYAERHWTARVERVYKKTGKALADKVIESTDQRAIKSLLKHSSNSEYPLWDKIRERIPRLSELEAVLGLVPIKGIGNCSLEDIVDYACSDADDTLALALLFDERRRDFHTRLNVQQQDQD